MAKRTKKASAGSVTMIAKKVFSCPFGDFQPDDRFTVKQRLSMDAQGWASYLVKRGFATLDKQTDVS